MKHTATLLTALLLAPLAALHAADSPRPNIVLIMADDQGWGDIGYNGHPELKTPNLDALAASGLRLDRFYAAHCNCSPTRGSVMTGRHPNRYGTYNPGAPIRAEELTVAKVLQSAGYATGHFGKWHLNGKNGDKNTTDMPGRAILAADPLSPGRMGFDEWVSADNFFDLDPVLGRNGVPEKFHGDSSDVTTDEALKFIRKQAAAGKPFLSVVWFGSPHVPHLALATDKAAYSALSAERAELLRRDHRRGSQRGPAARRLARTQGRRQHIALVLQRQRWSRRSQVHRQSAGRKGQLVGRRPPRARHCRMARAHRQALQQRVPCSTLDIYPTVLEATGAVAKDQIQPLDGESLIPLFEHLAESRTKPLPFWDHGTGHAAWLDWPYKLHTHPVTTRYKKGKQDADLPVTLLYDVSKDPQETTDLAAQEPERVAKMTAALQAWKASVEKSFTGADYGGQPTNIGKKKKMPKNAKAETK